MSKEIEEQTLEQTVPRKTTIRSHSVRPQNRDAARTGRTEEASKMATRAKSSAKQRLNKTKVVRRKNAASPETATGAEIIPGFAAKPQKGSQETGAHAGSEVDSELSPTTSQAAGVTWKRRLRFLAAVWSWILKHLGPRRPTKRLRVCESVSLGEKRFVAVIEVDGEQFLVGGAASSVSTLARLAPLQEFSEVLKRRWAQDPVQA
jgi:hypothetical protein